MEADILSIQDGGVRATLQPFPAALRGEAAALTELRFAVANQDVAAAKAALRHLQQAATERQQLGQELLDGLRPYVDPDVLQALLREAAQDAASGT
jgi:predicted lipid-binding transport protein (Tim44 family)